MIYKKKEHITVSFYRFFLVSVVLVMTAAFMAGCGKGESKDKGTSSDPTKSVPTKEAAVNNKGNNSLEDDIKNDSENDIKDDIKDNTKDDTKEDIKDKNSEPSPIPITDKEDDPEPSKPETSDPPIVLVLDPGHGGIFSGAVSAGLTEKTITLKVAGSVRDYLLENYSGIEVYLTRESDIELDSDIVIELEKRAVFAKEKKAAYFVSLHFNASETHESSGATIYASVQKDMSKTSRDLGNAILKQLVALGLKDNGVQTRNSSDHFDEEGNALDYYAVLRHNAARNIPAVIVEHCFMDNTSDQSFMDTDEKLKILAEADAKGIAEYLHLNITG